MEEIKSSLAESSSLLDAPAAVFLFFAALNSSVAQRKLYTSHCILSTPETPDGMSYKCRGLTVFHITIWERAPR